MSTLSALQCTLTGSNFKFIWLKDTLIGWARAGLKPAALQLPKGSSTSSDRQQLKQCDSMVICQKKIAFFSEEKESEEKH